MMRSGSVMLMLLALYASVAKAEPGDGPCQGVVGGVGLYLVTPHFENNPAYIVNDRAMNKQVRTSRHVDIDHGLEVAPQAWLGYIFDGGLGGRVRYWGLDADTNQSLASPNRVATAHPAGLSLLADQARELRVTSELELHVFDLEVFQAFQGREWDLLLSAGVRLARVRQSYDAFVTQGDGFQLGLLSSHTFEGAGPIVGGEVRRMLGETGLALYGTGRASLLFGDDNQNASIAVENNEGSDRRNRGMLIGELELGLEYGSSVCGTWVFGQVGLVGQNWFGAGSASRSTILVTPGNDVTGGGYSVDSDFAFLGVAFRLGVNY